MIWTDEFNYEGKPDPTKWNYEVGFKRNRENQYYTDSLRNVRVKDGYLILEAHKEEILNSDYKSKIHMDWIRNREFSSYSASIINTKDLAEFMYGRIEVKATLPRGKGLWPAIWMLGSNWEEIGWPHCGQINIMEHVGFNKDSIYASVTTGLYNYYSRNEKIGKSYINDPYCMFHVYAIEWTPEKIDFMLDGDIYYSYANENTTNAEWPFDQKFHLKLNVAVGGNWGGKFGVDDGIFPQQMIVDYVRVYQKQDVW